MTEALPPLRQPEGTERLDVPVRDIRMGGYAWWRPHPAPAVLLYHGWGQSAADMEPVARAFFAGGWHALSLSGRGWPGSGGSDDYGRSNVQDTDEVLAWLAQRPAVTARHLLGLSMGGLVALLCASRGREKLSSVTAVNAPTDLREVYRTTAFGGVRRYYDEVFTPEQWEDGAPVTHAAQLFTPALLVIGAKDRMVSPAIGHRYAQLSGAQVLEHSDMEHLPTDRQWEEIADAVMRLFGDAVRKG